MAIHARLKKAEAGVAAGFRSSKFSTRA